MMGAGIIWRMAWSNLLKNWRQTLLTIGAGAIGAILIAVTFVNYESLQHSIQKTVDRQLGPITWMLKPKDNSLLGFTQEQVDRLSEAGKRTGGTYKMLPYVSSEVTLVMENAAGDTVSVVKSALAINYPGEAAAGFDPNRADLWREGVTDGEVILGEGTAMQLGAAPGDVISLEAGETARLLRVKDVVLEQGLTGFVEGGAYGGTVIVAESLVREQSGLPEGIYPAVLSGTDDPGISENAMFLMEGVEYSVDYLKVDLRSTGRKMNFTLIIGFISAVAILSSMLFMRQVLVMIADSRREMYGVLKAIGLAGRQIAGMFAIEAMLLSFLSALVGCAAGIGAGMAFVSLFYGTYRDELARMAGQAIVIEPHISWVGALLLFVLVFAFLGVVSALSARKAGKFSAVEALRGEGSNSGPRKRKSKLLRWLLIGLGCYAVIFHFGLTFLYPPDLSDEGNMLWIVITWLGTCCAILASVIYGIGKLERPLIALLKRIGIPSLSLMLAVKYPRNGIGRIYTTSLLFSLIMMIVTMTVTIMSLVSAMQSVNRIPQTVLGSGGYAAYQSAGERDKIMTAARQDSVIAGHVTSMLAVEPYMLDMGPNKDGLAKAVIPVTKELLEGELPTLVERAPEYQNDQEAWKSVLDHPDSIILPISFKSEVEALPEWSSLKAGDEVMLPIFISKLRTLNEPKEQGAVAAFRIAGFMPEEAQEHLIDFYNSTFMHASAVEELSELGFKWSNQNTQGFVLFRFDYKDVGLSQELEQRFAVGGVLGFTVPYLDNGAGEFFTKRLVYSFVGFAAFSGLISLMGLAVVQFRSVRERSKQIAMMRCIGVPGKQLYWIFVLEGLFISGAGLLTGWAIGSTGSQLFIGAAQRDVRDYEQALVIPYPYEIVLPILGALLLLSLLLNMLPAKAALRLKAADALRMNRD
ncbi:ABC transporter permease [Paenibacillus sp. CAU 1782]